MVETNENQGKELPTSQTLEASPGQVGTVSPALTPIAQSLRRKGHGLLGAAAGWAIGWSLIGGGMMASEISRLMSGHGWSLAEAIPRGLVASGAWLSFPIILILIASGISSLRQAKHPREDPKGRKVKYYCTIGDERFAKKKFRKAEQAYQFAIELDINHAPAWERLGVVRLALSDIENGLSAFVRAIILDPATGNLWQRLGDILEGTGHPSEALYCYAQAVELGSTSLVEKLAALRERGIIPVEPAFINAWQPGTSAKSSGVIYAFSGKKGK